MYLTYFYGNTTCAHGRALDDAHLQMPLLSLQWFLCLYVNTLPTETALRVWDVFFNEGSIVLFRIGAALLKLNEVELTSTKDSGKLFSLLVGMGKNMMDAGTVRTLEVLLVPYFRIITFNIKIIMTIILDLLMATAYSSFRRGTAAGRPRAPSAHREVPKELTGLGVAHLGPSSSSRSNLSLSMETSQTRCESMQSLVEGDTSMHSLMEGGDTSTSDTKGYEGEISIDEIPDDDLKSALALALEEVQHTGENVLEQGKENEEPLQSEETDNCALSPTEKYENSYVIDLTPLDNEVDVDVPIDNNNIDCRKDRTPKPSDRSPHRRTRSIPWDNQRIPPHRDFDSYDIERWRISFQSELENNYKSLTESKLSWEQEELNNGNIAPCNDTNTTSSTEHVISKHTKLISDVLSE